MRITVCRRSLILRTLHSAPGITLAAPQPRCTLNLEKWSVYSGLKVADNGIRVNKDNAVTVLLETWCFIILAGARCSTWLVAPN